MTADAAGRGHAGGTDAAAWGLDGLGIGIAIGGPNDARDAAELVDWAERAEAMGLHSLWVPEMHFTRGSFSSPLLGLAAVASRTKRLRLGTTSLLLPIHPPERLGTEIAALDQMSGGRLLVGLGRGFSRPLFDAFGIDPASKRDRFDVHLDLILDRWEEGLGALPVQKPHPPLAVAAFGRKGLKQSARRGLPYLASPMEPLDILEENLAYHRENLPADLPPGEIVVPIMRVVHVAANDEETRRVKDALAGEVRPPGAKLPKALSRAADAPIHERVIVGSKAEVIDILASYRDRLRIDLLVVRARTSGASRGEAHDSLSRLVEEVAPALD